MIFSSKCLWFLFVIFSTACSHEDDTVNKGNSALARIIYETFSQPSNDYFKELTNIAKELFNENFGEFKAIIKRENEESKQLLGSLREYQLLVKDKNGDIDILHFFKVLEKYVEIGWNIALAKISVAFDIASLAKIDGVKAVDIIQPLKIIPREYKNFVSNSTKDVLENFWQIVFSSSDNSNLIKGSINFFKKSYHEPFDAAAGLLWPAGKFFGGVAVYVVRRAEVFLRSVVEAVEKSAIALMKILPKFVELYGDDTDLLMVPIQSAIADTLLLGRTLILLLQEIPKLILGERHICRAIIVDIGEIILDILENAIPVLIRVTDGFVKFFERYIRAVYRIVYDVISVILEPYLPVGKIAQRSLAPLLKSTMMSKKGLAGIESFAGEDFNFKKTLKAIYESGLNVIKRNKSKVEKNLQQFLKCLPTMESKESTAIEQVLSGNYIGPELVGNGNELDIGDALEALLDPIGILNILEKVGFLVSLCVTQITKSEFH